jgi:hypothetical protein
MTDKYLMKKFYLSGFLSGLSAGISFTFITTYQKIFSNGLSYIDPVILPAAYQPIIYAAFFGLIFYPFFVAWLYFYNKKYFTLMRERLAKGGE